MARRRLAAMAKTARDEIAEVAKGLVASINAPPSHPSGSYLSQLPPEVRLLGLTKVGNKFAVVEATVPSTAVKIRLAGFLEVRRALDRLHLEENQLYIVGKLK